MMTCHRQRLFITLLCVGISFTTCESGANRSFVIDYENDQFLMDGEPFRYVSGEMHYFRVPHQYWSDRLIKMKYAGLNAVQTYIQWNRHEPEQGTYDFKENLDVVSFISLANDTGLYVIIRAGPFIDAALDMGGLPSWLLSKNPNISLRTTDSTYLGYVNQWFGILLPKLKPFLYENGGPIISIQVENEYGSYPACDFEYMKHLRDTFRQFLGNGVVLFTTDGGTEYYMKCGKVEGIYATVDFGPGSDVSAAFQTQRRHEPAGPLVNSEYYPGWDDFWGYTFHCPSIATIAGTLDEILTANASVSMYMFTGGTTFGFTNGAINNPFKFYTSSYDYTAPISEAGDTTEKFMAIRNVISKHLPVPSWPVPDNTSKYGYGDVSMSMLGSLFTLLPTISKPPAFISKWPLSFEQMGQAYGYVLYETVITSRFMQPEFLIVPKIADRGYVFIDKIFAGTLSRVEDVTRVPIRISANQSLSILVENQGRATHTEPGNNDLKGIFGENSVSIGTTVLTDWEMTRVPLDEIDQSIFSDLIANRFNGISQSMTAATGYPIVYPALFYGDFFIPQDHDHPMDTFLNLTGWSKGVAFVNGYNLGRYWPVVGPHLTIFISKFLLKPFPEVNQIVIFEQENSPCATDVDSCLVQLVDQPNLKFPTPY